MADMLTVEELAAELRMTHSGARRLVQEGRVHGVRVGRRWLVSRAEVARVLAEGTGPKTPPPDTAPVTLAGGRTLTREQIA
jgi:excisionase family DNA binding protein